MINREFLNIGYRYKFDPFLESGDATFFLKSNHVTEKSGRWGCRSEVRTPIKKDNFLEHLDSAVLVREFGDPYLALAVAVIIRAVKDLESSYSGAGGLRSFFDSQGFELMVEGLGWDKEYFSRLFEDKFSP